MVAHTPQGQSHDGIPVSSSHWHIAQSVLIAAESTKHILLHIQDGYLLGHEVGVSVIRMVYVWRVRHTVHEGIDCYNWRSRLTMLVKDGVPGVVNWGSLLRQASK